MNENYKEYIVSMDLRENDHNRVKEMNVSSCEAKKSDSQWWRVKYFLECCLLFWFTFKLLQPGGKYEEISGYTLNLRLLWIPFQTLKKGRHNFFLLFLSHESYPLFGAPLAFSFFFSIMKSPFLPFFFNRPLSFSFLYLHTVTGKVGMNMSIS